MFSDETLKVMIENVSIPSFLQFVMFDNATLKVTKESFSITSSQLLTSDDTNINENCNEKYYNYEESLVIGNSRPESVLECGKGSRYGEPRLESRSSGKGSSRKGASRHESLLEPGKGSRSGDTRIESGLELGKGVSHQDSVTQLIKISAFDTAKSMKRRNYNNPKKNKKKCGGVKNNNTFFISCEQIAFTTLTYFCDAGLFRLLILHILLIRIYPQLKPKSNAIAKKRKVLLNKGQKEIGHLAKSKQTNANNWKYDLITIQHQPKYHRQT